MDKKQWQDLYNQLDTIHSEFYFAYPLYQNGSNKQKRKEGKRKVDDAIFFLQNIILRNFQKYSNLLLRVIRSCMMNFLYQGILKEICLNYYRK